MNCLYRHFAADGQLLYVGISGRFHERTDAHSHVSAWFPTVEKVTVEHFPTRSEALEAERRAIIAERPVHNVQYNRPRDFRRERFDASRDETRRVATLKPVYNTARDAANAVGVSSNVIRAAMANGTLGFVTLANSRGNFRNHITGWQLIDWLEAASAETELGSRHLLKLKAVR